MKQEINKKLEEITLNPDDMNITEEQAIRIANTNKCLKDSIFLEQLKNKLKYGYIGFTKFGIKKVIYHEVTAIDKDTVKELYREREAWYIKVLKGEWGAAEFVEDLSIEEREEIANVDGEFTPEDNICCLVFIDNGEYLYLTEELISYVFEEKKDDNFKTNITKGVSVEWLSGK